MVFRDHYPADPDYDLFGYSLRDHNAATVEPKKQLANASVNHLRSDLNFCSGVSLAGFAHWACSLKYIIAVIIHIIVRNYRCGSTN